MWVTLLREKEHQVLGAGCGTPEHGRSRPLRDEAIHDGCPAVPQPIAAPVSHPSSCATRNPHLIDPEPRGPMPGPAERDVLGDGRRGNVGRGDRCDILRYEQQCEFARVSRFHMLNI